MFKRLLRILTAFCVLLNYLCMPGFAKENEEDYLRSFENSALANPQKQEEFKLFDSSNYDFIEPQKPLFLPEEQKDKNATQPQDTYYQYSRAYLEKAIKDMKGGLELEQKGLEYMEILNPSLLLPIFGTTISMTGRKTFGLNYAAKKYKTKGTVYDTNQKGLNFVQEMQLKIQGKVNDRLFVDVDYDDQREDEQNISLSYRGKGEELVQSVDFGDIQASLPGTEFLSYNQRVFGAKMHLKKGGANLHLVGSQNKGEKKSKQFKGNSVFETVNIKDIGYIRRIYYDLTFGCNSSSSYCDTTWRSAIVPNSEKVYLDNHTNTGYLEAISAHDLNPLTPTTYPIDGGTAAFKLLTRGVDYSIDYNKNILIFTAPLQDTDVIAINYQNIDGIWVAGSANADPIIVKTPSDRYLVNPNEAGWQLEMKRYYNIGAKQIAQDNGQGNFILKLLESDGKETCPDNNPPDYCIYSVDYDKGIFEIKKRFNDPSIYNQTPVSAANRYFIVQYQSPTRTYFLDSNIVVQSETIKVNGATMARNKDYYVDYASGYLTFYNENLIGSSSIIDATYSVANDTSAQDTTLLGARFNYDFTDNISIGASILNDSGNKPSKVPNIGDTAKSLTSTEADFKVKDLEVTEGLSVSMGVEAAQSKKEENLFGYAMIDNMDQSKESVEASVIFNEWKIASNPSTKQNFLNAVHWDSQEIKSLEINPQAAATAKDTQNVLVIDYDFSLAKDYGTSDNDNEISLVFPISSYGADFTNKTLLELSMLGVENGPFINISFGTMSEKSDNYDVIPADLTEEQIFPTCSKYYVPGMASVPKTEDLRCTGLLTPSEDVGWVYVNPDGTWQRYDPFKNNKYNPDPQPNGIIDTQDLNGNGILDSQDFTSGGDFGYNGQPLIIDPSQTGLENDQINFSGWKNFQREISLTDSGRWGNIKQMRITLKRNPLGEDKGTIKIAKLAVSGNTWQEINSSASDALLPYGINNIDNPNYKPIFNDPGDGGKVFRELYGSISNIRSSGSNNVKEQALALQYDFTKAGGADNIYVQRNFSAMDFSEHKQFNFLLYNAENINPNTYFYLQIASDDNNYSQVKIPLDFTNQWRLYTLKMIDTNGDGVPERWEADCPYLTPSNITNEGILNYKRVGIIKAGFISSDPAAQGIVWLDDIFLGDAVVRKGEAYSAHAKINLDNWFETGAKVRYMDRDFQTPVSVAQKQDNTTQDYYFKFKRFKQVPISATYYRSDITTPDVLDYTSSNNVSLLDQGKVKRDKGTISAEYINPSMPRIGVEYTFASTDYQKMKRNDDNKTYAVNVNWTPSKKNKIKNITAGASLNKIGIDYSNEKILEAPSTYYNTKETQQNYSAKISFEPFKGSSIVPSYSLTTADEKRRYFDASTFKERKYDKYATENISISTNLRLNRWLAPNASYSINIKENNNLSPTSYTVRDNTYNFEIGEVKTVNRNSAGAITLGLNGRDIFPTNKLFSNLSLSLNYRIQDGDSWYYVDNDFNSLDKLWLRSSLGLNSPYSYRNNMTLRDTYSLTMRWMPFKEYTHLEKTSLQPLKNLSLISNASFSYQTTEYLGSSYKTKTTNLPDLIVYLDQVENFWTQNPDLLSGVNLKLKYNLTTNNVQLSEDKREASYGSDLRFILFNVLDTNVNYTHQTLQRDDSLVDKRLENYVRDDFSVQTSFNYKNFRFTPKMTYIYDRRTQVDNILSNNVKEIVPSLNIKADFNMPFSFRLPFASKDYLAANRVIWNTNISYSSRRSYTVAENRNLFNVNTSFDYELSKNIRFTLSGSYEIFKHLYIDTQNYSAYSFGSLLTIQF